MMETQFRAVYYWLPSNFRRGLLVRRRSARWIEAGIVFIHIPKAAGTSVNGALYGRFMGHVRASDIENYGSSRLKALPSFAITRNPWERLVSAYRFARRGRGVGGTHQAWVWNPEQYQSPECETFERFVREWLAPRNLAGLDQMFQPQSVFVCDNEGRVLIDHVGKLDQLESTYAFIRQATGQVLTFPKSNRSGESIDYRRLYTPELERIVGKIYAEDIDRFAYSFGDPECRSAESLHH